MRIFKTALIAALLGAVAITSINPASARYVRRGGGGAGPAVAAGIASLFIGGLIASQAYRPGPGYYGYAYVPGPGYYYGPAPGYGGAVAYCIRRFKSYDPYSMTYLGYDGYRHSCP